LPAQQPTASAPVLLPLLLLLLCITWLMTLAQPHPAMPQPSRNMSRLSSA
jgi:hypothetical protein